MATRTIPDRKTAGTPSARLSPQQLVGAYRNMLLARRLDDKEIQLKGQNKIFFQISGAGHEAILVAAGGGARPGYELVFSYFSEPAACFGFGITPLVELGVAGGSGEEARPAGGRERSDW